MNRYLLDTHVALWWLDDPKRISRSALNAIRSADSELHVSTAAMWELAIKKSVGRLRFPDSLPGFLTQMGVRFLDVRLEHALAVSSLPPLHGDPFDRIQIVQARIEGLTLVTHDRQLERYEVPCLRA